MDFLGIGPLEILLILVLALILLGPGKIPEVARTLGRTMRAIKKASAELTTAVNRELEATKNEAKPPQVKVASHVKPAESPSATDQKIPPSQDDQPTKAGEAPATK
ncbi:MAG: hypothetical protein A2144_00665 [Chloroflexi bacterium RBG_16_50_9]|nr:MAG: hypothetical protein A2144_00665 [Chloroflexi bacterium RBG_16_50_9]